MRTPYLIIVMIAIMTLISNLKKIISLLDLFFLIKIFFTNQVKISKFTIIIVIRIDFFFALFYSLN